MSRFDQLQAALSVKQRVFQALIIRFMIGRYGRDNLGFMWTIVEPMVLCLGVMAIWSFTKGPSSHGISMVAFVFTGYMPLTLWRHQTGIMVNAMRVQKFITIFRNISLMDVLLARLLLEYVSVSGSAIVVFLVLYNIGVLQWPYDSGLVLEGWLIMGAIGTGSGLLIASLSELSEIVEKVNQPMQYFLLPFCGCFFMIEWLPDSVKEYAGYVPLVHGYEIIRGGYFGPEVTIHADRLYAVSWALILAGVGCFAFEWVKDRVEA